MNLYFFRHAKAGPHRNRVKPDSKRPLTEEGQKQAVKVVYGLKQLEQDFTLILSSPYSRAFQTAQTAAAILEVQLHTSEHLAPDGSPQKLIAELKERNPLDNILLVGHEPCLTQLISVLLTGKPDTRIELKKAGVVKLSIDHGLSFGECGCLHWMLTPRQLTRLGKEPNQ